MAKGPTGPKISTGGGGENYKPGDPGYDKLLQKILLAEERAAAKLENVSSTLNESAEQVRKTNIDQSKIAESIMKAVDGLSDFLKPPSNSPNREEKQPPGKKPPTGDHDLIYSLLQVNEEILNATKVNTTVLEDILDALSRENIKNNANRQKEKNNTPRTNINNDITKNTNVNIGSGRGIGGQVQSIGIGLGAAGAGIGAFFLGLAGAEAIMEKLGTGDNIKKLLINVAEGLDAFSTKDLIAIGAAMGVGALVGAAGGSNVGMATGIGAIGFGIGAFFTGLAAGDKAMSWMNTDFESLKKATKGISDALSNLDERSLAGIGSLLAAGGAAGALFGPSKVAQATIGIGAVGLGIGAFFAGLGAGDAGLKWMDVDGGRLVQLMKNFSEGMSAFTSDERSLAVLGGLLAAGGAAGALFGPVSVGKATIGMGAIGLGIGAFFDGLGAGDLGLKWMDVDGGKLASLMKNLAEGLNAFSSQSLISLGALLGAGALFGMAGPEAAGAASLGIAIIGAGLATFLGSFAVLDKVAGAIGSDGSNLKKLLVNMADGLNPLGEINGDNLLKVSSSLLALGPSIAAFIAGDWVDKITGPIKEAWNWLTGSASEEQEAGSKKGIVRQLVDAIKPIEELDASKFTIFDTLAESFNKLSKAISNIAGTDVNKLKQQMQAIVATLSQSFGQSEDLGLNDFADKLNKKISILTALAAGGKIKGSKNWSNTGTDIDFGPGLLSPDLKLDQLSNAMSKINAILNSTHTSITPTENNQAAVTGSINQNALSSDQNSGPVVINNSTVNNNGAAGTGSVPGPATGGAISTAPQRSPLDNVLYGRAFSGGHQ